MELQAMETESMVIQVEKAERDNPEGRLISQFMDEEAAMVMDCPTGTARSRISQGRRMLQVTLMDYALERGLVMEQKMKRRGENLPHF